MLDSGRRLLRNEQLILFVPLLAFSILSKLTVSLGSLAPPRRPSLFSYWRLRLDVLFCDLAIDHFLHILGGWQRSFWWFQILWRLLINCLWLLLLRRLTPLRLSFKRS